MARVRAAMGGALLERVTALEWGGTAVVIAGGRALKLGIETRVEPFVRARSNSWILAEGRGSMRTMMIERDGGFAVISGSQRALPPLQVAHERQQYGLYGLMRFREARAERSGAVRSSHAAAPAATFRIGADGMPVSADYIVDSPEPGRPIREHVTFAKSIGNQGIRWPRRITIAQDGKPFLALAIEDFRVELAAAA